MAKHVVLDAMIKRADFAQQAESINVELSSSLKLEEIAGNSPMAKFLRKPDFQRETNHWSPSQVNTLIQSFVAGELIPALILWKSESFVFVIDGAHRLSALKAWVENDYGDGTGSYSFFSASIPEEQKAVANYTRRLVEKNVGRYSDYYKMTETDLQENTIKAKIHSTIFTRSLHVQWVQGNQEVAESSFFKINSQGIILDKTEELLLRNRRKSYAVGARSIVRAGTGHKYWSKYDQIIQDKIEDLALKQNDLLFQPHVTEPIKTLDLPLGGTGSPVEALKTLIDIFSLVDGFGDPKKAIEELSDDVTGSETLELLKRSGKLASRLSGNDAASLGLHPAIYFYTERGKHSRFLFLGTIKAISDAIRNNNKNWFKKFTSVRGNLEQVLINKKSLINQGLANVNSGQRIDRVALMLNELVNALIAGSEITDIYMLTLLGVEGAAGTLKVIDAPQGFSTDIKSAAFLKQSIENSPRCTICGGLLHPSKSVSYDHKKPVSSGGTGAIENAQLVHPYCNTAIKGNDTN